MNDCPRFGKIIKGCKFKPRYDVLAPVVPRFEGRGDATEILKACRPKIYVKDICVRCGKQIDRLPEPPK